MGLSLGLGLDKNLFVHIHLLIHKNTQ